MTIRVQVLCKCSQCITCLLNRKPLCPQRTTGFDTLFQETWWVSNGDMQTNRGSLPGQAPKWAKEYILCLLNMIKKCLSSPVLDDYEALRHTNTIKSQWCLTKTAIIKYQSAFFCQCQSFVPDVKVTSKLDIIKTWAVKRWITLKWPFQWPLRLLLMVNSFHTPCKCQQKCDHNLNDIT